MSHQSGLVSHGRGGSANIQYDDTKYADAEIVRTGVVGDQGDGPFSTGRGGEGNIGAKDSPRLQPHDHDKVPDLATRLEPERSHHFGRGGAGNEKHVHAEKNAQPEFHDSNQDREGFMDKLKHRVLGRKSVDEARK